MSVRAFCNRHLEYLKTLKSVARFFCLCAMALLVLLSRSYANKNLWLATKAGNLTEMRKLLERGDVDINFDNQVGYSPIMLASSYGENKAVELLLSHSEDVKDVGEALLIAAENGNEEAVQLLLNYDPSRVDYAGRAGFTALMYAAGRGRLETVRLLLANNADVNFRDASDHSAFEFTWQRKAILIDMFLKTNSVSKLSMEHMVLKSGRFRKQVPIKQILLYLQSSLSEEDFETIVSGYIDKFENDADTFFFTDIYSEILRDQELPE